MGIDFLFYMKKEVQARERAGKVKTAAKYRDALKSFAAFLHSIGLTDVSVDCLTPGLLDEYEGWLHGKRRVCRNTSAVYMRFLRSAYYAAVLDGECENKRPFVRVFTSNDMTRKRTLSIDELKLLLSLELKANSYLSLCRDLFFFSYFAHGMNFIDMAHLCKSNINGGRLLYARCKTGYPLSVSIQGALAGILNRYWHCDEKYVFPIFPRGDRSARAYDSALRRYNRGLKKLASKVGLDTPLSSYCSRHSFASIAYKQHVPVSIISQAMGHTAEKTTRIYLASLDDDVVDEHCRIAAMPIENLLMASHHIL